VIACLVDVSPWLCYEFVLEHRGTIAVIALQLVLLLLILEQKLYEWTLKKAVMAETLQI